MYIESVGQKSFLKKRKKREKMFNKLNRNIHYLSMRNSFCTHTHARARAFNGLFSGTTQVSPYQQGKTNLDFTEARDSEWQWHQLGHMQV